MIRESPGISFIASAAVPMAVPIAVPSPAIFTRTASSVACRTV